VPDRLSALDASFLYLEEPTAVMHVGSVAVFEPPDQGFDYERLVALVSGRIAYVPRYRQRVRAVPGRLANPVWVDDENFDVAYHVRRSALPGPGTEQQLADLVARLQSRALDRTRPLWELYLVEGLAGGRFAVVTKAHQAMVDGVNAVDIAQVVLEDSAEVPEIPTDTWRPAAEPTDLELVVGAVADAVRSPQGALDVWRGSADDVRATAGRVVGQLGSLLSVAARSATRPAPTSPLNVQIGEQRRYVMVAPSRRLTNLTVTNVPGPQHPMYAAGARMLASYPVMPLAKGQAVSIGLTSYDGGVFYGVNGDLTSMADVDVLGQCLVEALAELRESGR
jgi:diacylglycerol O-acyltransferase / wax synthase